MSGNSADSFSEDSEGEEDKEEVKVKTEVLEKKKGPGRPPRKKKPPNPPPTASPPVPVANANKRRCTPAKSGKSRFRTITFGFWIDALHSAAPAFGISPQESAGC